MKGTTMRHNAVSRWPWAAVGCALVAGLALALALDRAATPASAQAEDVRVTAQQLLINQRISQAGVRRSNEALELLAPVRPRQGQTTGWPTEAIRDGAISADKLSDAAVTEAKVAPDAISQSRLSPGVREALAGPSFAVVEADGQVRVAGDGTRVARGVAGVMRIGVGSYGVFFDKRFPCAVTASIEAEAVATAGSAIVGGPWLGPASAAPIGEPARPGPVPVHTFAADGSPADRPFHVVAVC